jgi:hypothetical protein
LLLKHNNLQLILEVLILSQLILHLLRDVHDYIT